MGWIEGFFAGSTPGTGAAACQPAVARVAAPGTPALEPPGRGCPPLPAVSLIK